MKKYFYTFILLVILVSCSKKEKTKEILSLNYTELSPYLHKNTDTTYIVNFWATWCKPCVEELPYFEKLASENKNEKVKVLLVSLDMPKQLDSRLKPFVKENNIQSQVILLNDPDQNSWIPKVDPHWGGEIPATVIYNKNKRMFYAKSFSYSELNKTLKQF